MPAASSIFLVLAAALGWSALGTLILLLPSDISPRAISAVRGGWIFTAFFLVALRRRQRLKFSFDILCTGFAYASSAYAYIASLTMIPVATAAPLHYTTPAFLIIGLALCGRGLPTRGEVRGVLFSITGSLLLLVNSQVSDMTGVWYAIASAVLWALYLAGQKSLSLEKRGHAAMAGGLMMILMGATDISVTDWGSDTWGVFALIGICSSVLPLAFLARASSHVSPTTASLLLLLEPVFAGALAVLVHHQVPSTAELIGLLLIVLGAAAGSGIRLGIVPSCWLRKQGMLLVRRDSQSPS